jgi:Asp/Glu/hydantoin racemase
MRHESRYINRKNIAQGIRLLVITPVHPEDGDEGPFPTSPFDRRMLLSTTQVDEILCAHAPHQISDAKDIKQVTPMILEKALWGESSGYDAIIINCMLDPGVSEARGRVKIPVVGIGRAATALASVIGERPARIYPYQIPVNQLANNEALTLKHLQEYANQQIQSRGVDVITFNCSYLGGASHRLQSKIGVPVIPTIDVGLRLAEMIALLEIRPKSAGVEDAPTNRYRRHLIEIRERLRDLLRSVRDAFR